MAVFDENKVRTEWSDELDGKKGWFSNFITDTDETNLQYYVENEMKNNKIYGICRKNNSRNDRIFRIDRVHTETGRSYFYPDDEEEQMEFDKSNLFIAGYNGEQVNIEDEGYFSNSMHSLKIYVLENNNIYFGKIKKILSDNFLDAKNEWQFFYRTKCAPQKKYIPWNKDTCPLHCGDIVKQKHEDFLCIVSAIRKSTEHVWLADATCAIDLKKLFELYELSDGTPCGQEVK